MIVAYKNNRRKEFPDLDINSTKDCLKVVNNMWIDYNKVDVNLYELERQGLILKSF